MEGPKAEAVALPAAPAAQPLLEMVLAVTLMLPASHRASGQGRGRAWHQPPGS